MASSLRILPLPAIALILNTLFACQVPFGTDRHDLVGDRIVAVVVTPEDDALRGGVALLVDGRPWQDEAVHLAWHWLDGTDPRELGAILPDDPSDADGPAPTLTLPDDGPSRLGLVATFPSGAVRRAFLALDGAPRPPSRPAPHFDPPGPWAPDATVTLSAAVDDPDQPPRVRWMTVGGRGTFLEQSRAVTRWDAAIVTREDGEEVARAPISEGPVTFVTLAVDERGGNAVHAEDAFVGAVPSGLWTPGGRFLPSAEPPEGTGPWLATLVADDASPTGLAVTDLVAVPALTPAPPLDCTVPVSGPFDPSWLFDGRCLRAEVDGTTVLVEGR